MKMNLKRTLESHYITQTKETEKIGKGQIHNSVNLVPGQRCDWVRFMYDKSVTSEFRKSQ